MNKKGLLIVVSGPSGSGKGTLLTRLIKEEENIFFSISATTRKPRESEENKIHYFFITKEEFEEQIEQGNMLEYAEYCGNFYGTPKIEVEKQLNLGKDVLVEIEVEGALQVMKKAPDALFIFIMPPSIEELEKRLIGRGTEPQDVIDKRIEKAKKEITQADKYQYIVVNDDLDRAYNQIKEIIEKNKVRGN
jgi:guanylate kinase